MSCPNEQPGREIDFEEFPTARGAIDHARASGARAIRVGSRTYVVSAADAAWLEDFGSAFCYLHEVQGRIVTIPVNH
jgi:hypothetical protein